MILQQISKDELGNPLAEAHGYDEQIKHLKKEIKHLEDLKDGFWRSDVEE